MTLLTRYEPFEGLFDELFRPAFTRADAGPETLPLAIDVREGADAYTVVAGLPGVKRDAIEVEIDGNEVRIAAEAARVPAAEGERWVRTERHSGRFARRIALAQEIDEARASARYTDGLLELTLPKKAPASRKIAVQ